MSECVAENSKVETKVKPKKPLMESRFFRTGSTVGGGVTIGGVLFFLLTQVQYKNDAQISKSELKADIEKVEKDSRDRIDKVAETIEARLNRMEKRMIKAIEKGFERK